MCLCVRLFEKSRLPHGDDTHGSVGSNKKQHKAAAASQSVERIISFPGVAAVAPLGLSQCCPSNDDEKFVEFFIFFFLFCFSFFSDGEINLMC